MEFTAVVLAANYQLTIHSDPPSQQAAAPQHSPAKAPPVRRVPPTEEDNPWAGLDGCTVEKTPEPPREWVATPDPDSGDVRSKDAARMADKLRGALHTKRVDRHSTILATTTTRGSQRRTHGRIRVGINSIQSLPAAVGKLRGRAHHHHKLRQAGRNRHGRLRGRIGSSIRSQLSHTKRRPKPNHHLLTLAGSQWNR